MNGGLPHRAAGAALALVILIGLTGSAWAKTLWNVKPGERETAEYRAFFARVVSRVEGDVDETPEFLSALRLIGDYHYSRFDPDRPEIAVEAIEAYAKVLKLSPDDPEARYHMAQLYFWLGDPEYAVAHLDLLLARDPENVNAKLQKAEIFAEKIWTRSIGERIAREILDEDPENTWALLILARINGWRKEYHRAVDYYESLFRLEPEHDEARLEYAEQLMAQKLYKQAIRQYSYLRRREAPPLDCLQSMALAYYRVGQYNDSRIILERIFEKHPDNGVAWGLRGRMMMIDGNDREAVKAFLRALAADENDVESRWSLARIYAWDPATFPEAVAAYRQVVEALPERLEPALELAELYTRARNFENAIELYGRLAEQRQPDDRQVRIALIQTYLTAGRPEDALAETDSLLAEEADNLQARLLRGDVLLAGEHYPEAIAQFEEVTADRPDEMTALLGLAWAHHRYARHYEAEGRLAQAMIREQWPALGARRRFLRARKNESLQVEQAERLIERAQSEFPNAARPWLLQAEMRQERFDFEGAAQSCEAAVRVDPESVAGLLCQAWINGRLGRREEAVEFLQQAAAIHPGKIAIANVIGEDFDFDVLVAEAIEHLEHGLTIHFFSRDLHRFLARVFAGHPDTRATAVVELRRILANNPEDREARLLLARVLARLERPKEALTVYEQVLGQPPWPAAVYYEKIELLVHLEGVEQVALRLREMRAAQPDNQAVWIAQARFDQVVRGDYLLPVEHRRILADDTVDPLSLLVRGDIYRRRGDHERAAIEYRKALAVEPLAWKAYYGLGVVERRSGRYDSALDLQRRALALQPRQPDALLEIAYDYYLAGRKRVIASSDYWAAPILQRLPID